MSYQQPTVAERIMDFVAHHPGCLLEEVVLGCPELSWNQVFSEVDRLSRDGRIELSLQGPGLYTLRMPGYLGFRKGAQA